VSARERTPFPKVDVQINLVRAWGLRKSKHNKSYSNIVRYNPASSTYHFHCRFISSMSLRSLRKNVLVPRFFLFFFFWMFLNEYGAVIEISLPA
jgi:hypothetical protein